MRLIKGTNCLADPVPWKPLLPSPFLLCSPSESRRQAKEKARRSCARPPPFEVDSDEAKGFRRPLLAYLCSPLSRAPRDAFLPLPGAANRRGGGRPKLTGAPQASVRFPSPFRDAELIVTVSFEFAVSPCASSSPRRARRTTGSSSTSMAEPPATVRSVSGDHRAASLKP